MAFPSYSDINKFLTSGRGGGLVVSILAFYSDDPSSNPAGYLIFLYEKRKINKKRPGLPILKNS